MNVLNRGGSPHALFVSRRALGHAPKPEGVVVVVQQQSLALGAGEDRLLVRRRRHGFRGRRPDVPPGKETLGRWGGRGVAQAERGVRRERRRKGQGGLGGAGHQASPPHVRGTGCCWIVHHRVCQPAIEGSTAASGGYFVSVFAPSHLGPQILWCTSCPREAVEIATSRSRVGKKSRGFIEPFEKTNGGNHALGRVGEGGSWSWMHVTKESRRKKIK